nr:unnamed protein product [Digitaria exilis]
MAQFVVEIWGLIIESAGRLRRQWLTTDLCARVTGLRAATSTDRAANCDDHFSPSHRISTLASAQNSETLSAGEEQRRKTTRQCVFDDAVIHSCAFAARHANRIQGGIGHGLLSGPQGPQLSEHERRSNAILPVMETTQLVPPSFCRPAPNPDSKGDNIAKSKLAVSHLSSCPLIQFPYAGRYRSGPAILLSPEDASTTADAGLATTSFMPPPGTHYPRPRVRRVVAAVVAPDFTGAEARPDRSPREHGGWIFELLPAANRWPELPPHIEHHYWCA